ncbi:hypothetical protein HYV86_04370 [Candidatus Woesearchaeota archaeon]|nr:hypothetical protein [Candidatus Woesearchaeota archaeon]
MPEVLIENTTFQIYCDGSSDWQPINKENTKVNSLKRYSLTLHNIGLGPAKNFSARWRYDLKKAINVVNELGNKNINVKQDRDFVEIKIGKRKKWVSIFPESYNPIFIESNKKPQEDNFLDLPLHYQALFASMIEILSYREDLMSMKRIKDFPKLYLEMNYSDVSNNKYIKMIYIKIDTFFLQTSKKDQRGDLIFQGRLIPLELPRKKRIFSLHHH